MKFIESKKNFSELKKDFKAVVCGSVGLVVDVAKIPVALCKDFRNGYLESKKRKEVVDIVVEANKTAC